MDEAAVMEWAKKNGGADGWGPKGPTMADIMKSWDQSLLEDRPMGLVMKILLTITMVLALIFLVILTLCCWRFRREQLAYGVQLTERVRAMMRRSTEDTRRTPPPPLCRLEVWASGAAEGQVKDAWSGEGEREMTIGERVVPMGEGDALHGVVWGSGVHLRVTDSCVG